MNSMRGSRRACRFLSNSALAATFLVCQALWLQAAPPTELRVELECKLTSPTAGLKYRRWIVLLRKANGDPLLQAMKGTGDTFRVKDLKPGIYQLCIQGVAKEHCESVDLHPPANKTFFRFRTKLITPESNAGIPTVDPVSVAELSIPREARMEMSKSEEAELLGNSENALHHLERALAIDPDYPDALNNMGVHYYRTRDYAKSVEFLRKATDLDPHSYTAWANLGSSILASGQFQEALKVNRMALDMRPGDARANMQLGLNYYYVRDYSESKRYLEKALSLDPKSASSPQLFLAEIAILEKKHSDAERYIRDFLSLHPNSPDASRLKEVLADVEANHFVSVPSVDLNAGP